MRAVAPTLKPDDSGNQVANLQAALVFLLERDVSLFFDLQQTPTVDELKAARDALLVEASAKFFDKTTRALTFAFQLRQGLMQQLAGVVDKTTADALNERLRQYGALNGDKAIAVRGRVLREGTTEPQPGVRVRALAYDAAGELDLGESDTDSGGTYRIEFSVLLIRVRPDDSTVHKGLRVRAFRPDGTQSGFAQMPNAMEDLMVLDVVIEADDGYLVQGRITDTLSRPRPGHKVQAYDRDYQRESVLGQATTDEAGHYRITFPASLHRKTNEEKGGPELFVRALDAQGQMLAQSRTVSNAGASTELNLTLPDDLRMASGTVLVDTGRPLPGLLVRAFDRDLRSEELLGQATTDSQGRYRVAYSPAQFRRAEKASADLIVRVLSANGETELAASEIVFNAPAQAQVDFTIGADKLNTDSEWERYGRELAPLLGYASTHPPAQGSGTPLPPHTLTDEDIDFLHYETGIALDHLRFIRMASRWWIEHKAHKLPAEAFYGLLRRGLPADWALLLRSAPSTWRAALKLALAERIVPAALASQIEHIIATLTELAIDQQFSSPAASAVARPPLGALIAGSGIKAAVQRRVVGLMINKGAELLPHQIWPMLAESGIAEADVRRARFAMEAHEMVAGHLPTLKALQSSVGKGFGSGADLARLDRKQWLRVATAVAGADGKGLPAGMASAKAYAESLADGVELRYPTQVVAHALQADKKPVRRAVGQVLQAKPEFDLLRGDVQALVDSFDFSSLQVPRKQVEQQLKAEVRAARMAPPTQRAKAMAALLQYGLDSAVKVARAGAVNVKRKLVPIIGDAPTQHVIAKADARLSDATMQLARVGDLLAWPPMPHLPRLPIPTTAPPPTWSRMFGAGGGCKCLSCNSVHGPAAYLADLLHFLSRMDAHRDDGLPRSLLDVLTERRRPDLLRLKLDCANAETPLPYVDLVIEHLERLMMPTLPVAQTPADRSAEWLRALPEQTLLAASLYSPTGQLMVARYPWNLPFDRAHRLASIHLGLAGATMADVLHELGGTEADTARARLGISAAVWNALHARVDTGEASVAGAWGVGRRLRPLLSVPRLLKQALLPWPELHAVIASPMFESLRLELDLGSEPCDVSGHRLMQRSAAGSLVELVGAPLVATFDLLHRTLRLRQAMGWSLDSTLRVLQALGVRAAPGVSATPSPASIDLVAVARLLDLSRKLHGDVAVMADHLRALADGDATGRQEARASWAALLGASEADWAGLADLGATTRLESADSGAQRLQQLEAAHTALKLLREARIDVAELRYLLRGLDLVPAVFAPLQADTDAQLDRILANVRAVPAPATGEPDARRAAVIEQLTAISASALTPALVLLMSATVAGATGDVTQDFVAFAEDPGAHRPHAQRSLRRVMAAARLVALLKLTAQDLGALAAATRDNTLWLDFDSLVPPPAVAPPYPAPPWAALHRLLLVSRAQATLPEQADRLLPLLTRGASIAELDAATGWGQSLTRELGDSAAALEELFSSLRDSEGRAWEWGAPEALHHLQRSARWLQARRLLAAEANLMRAATAGTASFAELNAFSRARFLTERAWLAALAPAMDRLRVEQRDAMVAHLLHTRAAEFRSVPALYEHLLIDVQMGACQLSSRIVQAHSAIQLFVQRCLLRLEPGVSLGDVSNIQEWKQWTWMKQYRVWEAGRKIFLYPENWIEPDLRTGKSPFFEFFESELLQDEVKPETVERAVRNYLVQLHEVARLDIRAIYEEFNDEPLANGEAATRRVLHMVGRTRGTPHIHFYRRREDDLSWSPWQKIDLSIDGDHLALAVHNRRPILFWPQWSELEVERDGGTKALVWNMHLNYSALEFGRWAAPSRSATWMQLPRAPDNARPGLALRPRLNDDGRIEVLVYRYLSSALLGVRPALGFMVAGTAFVVDACTGEVQIALLPQPILRYLPAGVMGIDHGLLEPVGGTGSATSLRIGLQDEAEREVDAGAVAFSELLRTGGLGGLLAAAFIAPATTDEVSIAFDDPASGMRLFDGVADGYRLVPAHQYAQWNGEHPYVWQHDGKQLFLVRRTEGVLLFVGGWSVFLLPPTYVLEAGEHPYACDLLEALRAEGVDGLYRPAEGLAADGSVVALRDKRHPRQLTTGPDWVAERLQPNPWAVSQPYPRDRFEFADSEAYGLYNWEVFFHIPLLVADRLGKNQKHEEAQRWLHTLFDPTDVSPHRAPQKFWRVKPLFEEAGRWPGGTAETLEATMRRLTQDAADVADQVRRWRNDPFNPHLIASVRVLAYMKTVVQKYVQNLLDWGDRLFWRDTTESINEATQLYELASYLMGVEPTVIELPHHEARTYGELASLDTIDEFSNVLVDFETALPIAPPTGRPDDRPVPRLASLYFCIPPNARLSELRATVADRLFKIRHCMDLDGRTRQLALFAPPIDPALLVRARAAGLGVGGAIEQALAPTRSPYRFSFLLGKAMELAGDVRAFGAALLSALEKRDGEQLAQLRSRHDLQLQRLAVQTRERQIEEAEAQLDAAIGSRAVAELRRDHYTSLLSAGWTASEKAQIVNLHVAHGFEMTSGALRTVAGVMHLLPEVEIGLPPKVAWGGPNLGRAFDSVASSLSLVAQQFTFEASMAGYNATYERRAQEWRHQIEQATREIAQIDQQIAAAQIRVQIARHELRSLEQQVAHSEEVEGHLRDKFTSTQLYAWMSGHLAALHYQAYRMAFDLARQAEAAAERELGPDVGARVRFDAWDGGRSGLLAGERLAQDLRRLELSYMQRNERRLEISTSLSLRRLNPAALWKLRTTRSTGEFTLPTWLFDMDFPGQTDRRIKSVSVSIPGVVGPYGGVNGLLSCTLGGYAGRSVIATSTGQNDAGVFQLDFRDERYLPFEGIGLSLPEEPARWSFALSGVESFDHDTISDMILHVQYTARPGEDESSSALDGVLSQLRAGVDPPLAILLSPRLDFPVEYRRLVEGGSDGTVQVELDDRLFPYFARSRSIMSVAEWPAGASAPTRNFSGYSASDGTIELTREDAFSAFLVEYVLSS